MRARDVNCASRRAPSIASDLQLTGAVPTRGERRDAATQARLRFERHNERLTGLLKKNRRAGGAKADVNRQVVERAVARARERLALRGTPRK